MTRNRKFVLDSCCCFRWRRHCDMLCQVQDGGQGEPCEYRRRR